MRSMEIFRQLGLADLVHDAARDLAGHDHMAVGNTLAEARQLPLWQASGPGEPAVEPSPELPCLLSQDLLEPLLRTAAVDAGVDVRFDTELMSVDQSHDGVDAQLRSRRTGRRCGLTARYLIAADGAGSPLRETLGITRSTNGFVGRPNVNVYFSADLGEVVEGREFNLCQITHPDAPGTLASVDGRRRWVFHRPGGDTDRGLARATPTRARCPRPEPGHHEHNRVAARDAGRRCLPGRSRVPRRGCRARHAPVCGQRGQHRDRRRAQPRLEARRGPPRPGQRCPARQLRRRARPAGWFAADESPRRTQQIQDRSAPDPTLAHPYVLAAGGFQYTAGGLATDPALVEAPEPVTCFDPRGRVGTRVPHRWLDPDRTRSTIDLAGPDWAILTRRPLPPIPSSTGDLCVGIYQVNDIDFLDHDVLVLLRPDHIVAWRGTDPDKPLCALRTILRS